MEWKKVDRFKENGLGSQVGIGKCLRSFQIVGLKEKLLAARMAHIEKVLVPAKNRPDVEELSREITKGMEIVFVTSMEEVLKEVLLGTAEKK